MSADDARIERLPKWARDEIKGLERRVATLEKRLADIPEDGAVAYADAYGFITGRRRPVAQRGESIRFYLNETHESRNADYIEVTAQRGYLDVSCDQRIVIIGQASNCVTAEVRQR